MDETKIVVCGAGGFIGGHLVADLIRRRVGDIRAIDLKPLDQWYQVWKEADNRTLDLRRFEACREALMNADIVYNLAADMGGMGFIESNRALCMLNVLINTHLLEAAQKQGVARFFFASSRLCLQSGFASGRGGTAAEGGGCLSGDA